MNTFTNKRSTMTLHSDPLDPYSHQVRFVLAEKSVAVVVNYVSSNALSEELLKLNPYGILPILVDRDLVLYDSQIIIEYLDERFPHPPLMPVYPVTRAECRRMIYWIRHDCYPLMNAILSGTLSPDKLEQTRTQLHAILMNIAPIFSSRAYFLSDEFTLVDCWFAPLLWRLPLMDIYLPQSASAVNKYASRLFERPSFAVSLSEAEREWQAA